MSILKFAVVREDPDLECELVQQLRARQVLLVASGGCTALTLRHRFPGIQVTAFDINPAQLQHVRDKASAVARAALPELAVGTADPACLNQRGRFEGLFRTLRAFLIEFVTSEAELEHFFAAATEPAARAQLIEKWSAAPYFPIAFQLAFHDALLCTMFGPAAIQHAAPGSYPAYFQAAFLRGLRRLDAADNPFLQHVLLGRYLPRSAPDYTGSKVPLMDGIELVEASLPQVPELGRFALYSLSNVFDWSDDRLTAAWARAIAAASQPGAAVLIRQLNNSRDVRRFFAPEFEFDPALGADMQRRDRSLFYERIEVGFRRGSP